MSSIMEKVKTAMTAATEHPATPGGYKGEELSAQYEKECQYRSESHVMKAPIDLDHNMAIVLTAKGTVELKDIGPIKIEEDHEILLRVTTSALCGSDLHMYRYRTNATSGTILGHEVTGEVIECGSAVKFIQKGDYVIVPFNVACGCCTNCKQQQVNCCLFTNKTQPGGIHGYTNGGGHLGGQALYKVVPYADFNVVKCPDKHRACEEILDMALLPDVLPTGFHAAKEGGVGVGSIVYVAGAGPVGLTTVACSFLLGASIVICGDVRPSRLENAKKMGAHTIDLSILNYDQAMAEVESILCQQKIGQLKRVDVAIDCVGYECTAIGEKAGACNQPNTVINFCIDICKYGGTISVAGLYFPADPKGPSVESKVGKYDIDFGKLWTKMLTVKTGQTPCLKYEDSLMRMILCGRLDIAKYLNCKIISLEEAPEAYKSFGEGEPCKYIIIPHEDIRTPVLERLKAKQNKKAISGTESGVCPPCPSTTTNDPMKPTHIAKIHGHPAGQEPKEAATTTEHMAHKETKPTKYETATKNKGTQL